MILLSQAAHRLLKARRLVHLVFVGFAVNICVQFRDYGMRAMRDRGYRPILLCDATSAIETCETYDRLAITDMVVKDV